MTTLSKTKNFKNFYAAALLRIGKMGVRLLDFEDMGAGIRVAGEG